MGLVSCLEAIGKSDIPSVYNPHKLERNIYQFWLQGNYFHAEVEKDKTPFCIVIPPPNVTGSLHIGHALDNSLQDILIRWRRMQGYNTLWVPGTDHAGIATQVKVEADLAKEGLSRYDLGRERFLERVWAWKRKYGGQIISQLQRLGASCDWQRERFTMDEGCSRAVREVFVRLYEKGLIYQGEYIINWCPRCKTSLSDLEVEHKDERGALYYIRYPFKDGEGAITVATTRPETMLGDVAIAVNPHDERYAGYVGRTVILPIIGREIPIIADEYADPQFGTGAVKVTPAHDPNDFEMGMRHKLPSITVIGEDGTMTAAAQKYAGLDRYKCREAVVAELKEKGLLVKVEDHDHAVGHCQRCHTAVEPLLSKQWFVRMKPLAEPAIRAVEEGRIRFIPERFTKIYLNWMENVHDWCISRQLWWGHRIPVWYCRDCGEVIVSRVDPESCTRCAGSNIEQDPDVLDTWFSSALWPFSTLGWPDDTPELRHFYPTSVLVTAYDIIFFWVARMIFMGLEFMKEVPFREVFIHGLVRNPEGRKMSKSLGTGVDPLDFIDQYGADTLRFTLVTGNTPGNDMRFRDERVEASRNFANKIWNASRFVMMNLHDFDPRDFAAVIPGDDGSSGNGPNSDLQLPDRWILSRVNGVAREVTRFLEKYEIGEAARLLYDFIWGEFCDWYVELVKPRLYSSEGGEEEKRSRRVAQYVLWYSLQQILKLLHPFMPFITEGIWQALPGTEGSIMVKPWPRYDERLNDGDAEARMGLIMEVVRSTRNLRAELNITPQSKIRAVMIAHGESREVLEANSGYVSHLAGLSELVLAEERSGHHGKAISAIAKDVEIFVPVEGLIDVEREVERLRSDLSAAQEARAASEMKLRNPNFVTRANPDVVERERVRLAEYSERIERLEKRLRELS
ncbi:MAG TPA: valine--tRNA ligase [Firmicutes bacterium]|nr:valine--tRNA ligase [Bacillota bacterium]